LPVAEEYFRRDAIQLAGLHVRCCGPSPSEFAQDRLNRKRVRTHRF
jgi:hypothetical protein